MTSDLHAHQSIAGSRSREGDRIFHAWDPATGTRLEPGYVDATEREIDHAATAAQDAFVTFGRSSGQARADLLDAIAGNVTNAADAIVTRAQAETGLPEARLRGELGRTTGQLRLFADMLREGSWVDARIDTADPSRSPAAKPDIRRMLVPLGPVAVFGASNFPLAFSVAGGDTASALAAGCPVLVKGHPAHPGTSELVATAIERAVRDAGMPAGIFSLLHGAGHDVGGLLARHPGIRAVAFTGSFGGGRALFDAAARRDEPIPVFAEMGSSNPVFVLPRALESRGEHIAEGLYASFTLGVGQFCTNPGVTVLPDADGAEAFRRTLSSLTRDAEPGTMLHEGIRGTFDAGIERLTHVPGVRLLSRSEREGVHAATAGKPTIAEVDATTFLEQPTLAEEVFGPSTLLVGPSSSDQMLAIARSLRGHLTATLFAEEGELEAWPDLVRTLEDKVGRLIVNGYPTGVEVVSSMQHGGPYPATTDPRFTSVGTAAVFRFVRPLAFQDAPAGMLPEALRNENRLGILRIVDGERTRKAWSADAS